MSIVLSFVQPYVGRKRVLIYFVLQHHSYDKVKYLHCAQSTIAVSRCTDLARAEDRLYSIRGFLQRKFKQVLNEHVFLYFFETFTPSHSPLCSFAQVSKMPKNTCENCSTYSFIITKEDSNRFFYYIFNFSIFD